MATKAKAKAPPRARDKWRPIMLVTAYKLTRAGVPETELCKALGVSRQGFWNWKRDLPELAEALALAEADRATGGPLADLVWYRLPEDLQKLYKQLKGLDGSRGPKAGGLEAARDLLAGHGSKVRQRLFLFALVETHFSRTRAMARLGLTRAEVDGWVRDDVEFAGLLAEAEWHKGNFYEEALVRAVAAGETSAIVFANKTFNRDRGYAQKSEVDVNVSGQVTHGVLDLAELLPLMSAEVREGVLGALRRREELQGTPQLIEHHPGPDEIMARRLAAEV